MTTSNKETGALLVSLLVIGGLVLSGCSSTQQKTTDSSAPKNASTASSNLEEEQEAIKEKSMSFFWKGNKKFNKEDYKGAILDFNEAIQIRSDYYPSYMMRGLSKNKSGDTQGAITDMQKAADMQKKNGDIKAYDDTMETIADWKKSVK
jgi:Tfp pilus assembly protein PilF